MATWSIVRLDCFPQYDGRADVVSRVVWECSDSQNGHSASASALCFVPPPNGAFVPYNQLTQQTVLDWIWANGVDKPSVEARVAQDIERQANPPILVKPLPWS
jgi:hypothetical protein